jgi:hypothetical protein
LNLTTKRDYGALLARGLLIVEWLVYWLKLSTSTEQYQFDGRCVLIKPDAQNSPADIVVFYPGDSLIEQLTSWSECHPDCNLAVSYAKSLLGIRRALGNADVALLDATAHPRQTMEAFSQAIARIGPNAMAVYTERMHEWLELAVRIRGVMLLLGPLSGPQWEGFFERMLPSVQRPLAERFASQKTRKPAGMENGGLAERSVENHFSAGLRRPKTGVK